MSAYNRIKIALIVSYVLYFYKKINKKLFKTPKHLFEDNHII